jgi:hypothetical protein
MTKNVHRYWNIYALNEIEICDNAISTLLRRKFDWLMCCIGPLYAYGQTCFNVGLQPVDDTGRFERPPAFFLFDWEAR